MITENTPLRPSSYNINRFNYHLSMTFGIKFFIIGVLMYIFNIIVLMYTDKSDINECGPKVFVCIVSMCGFRMFTLSLAHKYLIKTYGIIFLINPIHIWVILCLTMNEECKSVFRTKCEILWLYLQFELAVMCIGIIALLFVVLFRIKYSRELISYE